MLKRVSVVWLFLVGLATGAWAGDGATIVSSNLPAQMSCGSTYAASVTVKNTGTTPWTTDVYKLGAPGGNDPLGGPARVYLTSSVPPGGQYTFCFTLTAPAADTTVTTTWQMVHEKVAFFGGAASQAVTVSCGGGSAQCTSGIKPYPWKPQYLADPVTGQPVLLTGQGSIVPGKYTREQTSDYIDRFRASGIRYVRVWTLQLEDSANWPWTITADGPYFNQGVHWDWNPTYWDRLRAALAYADSADPSQVVYAEVQLFDSGCTGFDHGGQSPAQHVVGDPERFPELLITAATEQGVPENQQRPWVAEHIQRAGDRAVVRRPVRPQRHRSSQGDHDHTCLSEAYSITVPSDQHPPVNT